MNAIKQFVVIAKPNQNTWCSADKQLYEYVLTEGESGEHLIIYYNATNEDHALGQFHKENSFERLADWEIEVEEMNP